MLYHRRKLHSLPAAGLIFLSVLGIVQLSHIPCLLPPVIWLGVECLRVKAAIGKTDFIIFFSINKISMGTTAANPGLSGDHEKPL